MSGDFQATNGKGNHNGHGNTARIRLSKDLLNGRYPAGQPLRLAEIAKEYNLDQDSAVGVLADLHALGMVKFSGPRSAAVVHSPHPKEMYEAYKIRAALEEIGGRAAATLFKGSTADLQGELNSMRAAVRDRDLDSYAEHDVKFHRTILETSGNDVLLRVWDSLVFDVRIRAAIGKVTRDLPEVVESHQPIIDALWRGQGREAGLLLRNHVETFLQFLKKAEIDSVFFDRDLEVAQDVQKAFIPQRAPSIPGLTCETFYSPAYSIGGDYYDFFPLQSGRWGIAIGDVSGKGIGAALVMANLQASVRAQALQLCSDPSTLINHVNHLVYKSSPVHFYATLFYAEFDPKTLVLTHVNAGHNPPIVVRCQDGTSKVTRLQPGSAPVGMFEDSPYSEGSFQLKAGDILVACTDGLVEAENPEGEPWGQQRLESLFLACKQSTPRQVLELVVNEVSAFAGGSQRDDMTLVVLQVGDEGCRHERRPYTTFTDGKGERRKEADCRLQSAKTIAA